MVVIYQIEEREITRQVVVEDNADQQGTYKLSFH